MSVELSVDSLRAQILLAPIPDLEPHIACGNFILLDASLDLAETAFHVASNDDQKIAKLIEHQLLRKAAVGDIDQWKTDKSFFNFLIVQPFVLAQKFVDLANS